MGFWRDIIEGFTGSVLTVAANQAQALPYRNGTGERGRIERLCSELGWSIDERERDAIWLYFNNSGSGIRKVRIMDGDEALVTFSSSSFALLPGSSVSADLLGYLLCRNLSGSGMGTWGTLIVDDDKVLFLVIYQALGAGLDAAAFKHICQSLVAEAAELDSKLRACGLLR